MDEKLKKAILENEELLEMLLAIHFNNKSTEDGTPKLTYYETDGDLSQPFKDASYYDIEYNKDLLNKWKNSNADEMLKQDLEANKDKTFTEEEIKQAKAQLEELAEAERGLYNEEVKELTKLLSKTFLNKAFFVVYESALTSLIVFIGYLTRYFYAINKYKGTKLADTLRGCLEPFINETEVNTTNVEVLKEVAKRPNFDYSYFSHNVKVGLAFSEVIINASKGQSFTRENYDNFIAKYREDKGDVIEDLSKPNDTEEDKATNLLEAMLNYNRIEKLLVEIRSFFDYLLRDYAKDNGIKEPLTEEDLDKCGALATKLLNELITTEVAFKERTKDFKNNAVKLFIRTFAMDDETKELVADAIIIRPTKEETRKEHALNFVENENVSKEWAKENVNPINASIMNQHTSLATYNENNLERKEQELKELNYKINKLEDKLEKKGLTDAERKTYNDLIEEAEAKENDVNETKNRLQKTKEDIEKLKEDLKNASKELLDLEDEPISVREKATKKRILNKKVRSIETDIKLKEKSINNRGLFLQLAIDESEPVLTSTEEVAGGSVSLFIKNSDKIEKKFTYEATKLLRYLQDKIYYIAKEDNDDYILIDIDDYTEETGRSPRTYKHVRQQLTEAVELLQDEYFRVSDINIAGYKISQVGKIILIDGAFLIEPTEEIDGVYNGTRKTTLAIHLGKVYRQLLFNDKVMQWASIPRLINKVNDKQIKSITDGQEPIYRNTNALLVQELAYYLYEDLRKNLKKNTYYKKTFYIRTLVNILTKRGVLASNKSNRYSRRVIEPLEETLNYLTDELKLIDYDTQAFIIYNGYYDEETGTYVKGLAGSSEAVIKKAFEDAKITIHFKVYDKETYDNILENNTKYKARAKKLKDAREKKQLANQLKLLEEADFIEK